MSSKISKRLYILAQVLSQTHQLTIGLVDKAPGTFARLSARLWDNLKLITRTSSAVYICIVFVLCFILFSVRFKLGGKATVRK